MVPGDIVKIKGGDNVPADMILFATNEMKVNNASLTGEPEELLRKVDIKTQNIFESPNVAFFGTMCTAGLGQGVVFRTGDDTVIGRIANLSESAEKNQTPLSIEIERFIFIVSAVAIFLGVTFFFIGWIVKGADIVTNLVFCIGIIVANVPEGLLATVTVSLALTASRMAKKKVLVKNLESVETLGSTSCICSDKTGTLTQNRMTVSQMYFNMEIVDCGINWEIYKKAEEKELAKGEDANMKNVAVPKYDFQNAEFKELVKTMALSTTSIFAFQPSNEMVRARTATELKVNINKVPKDPEPGAAGYDDFVRIKQLMIDEEKEMNFIKRNVEGDASETGLVKFAQPALMEKYGGDYVDGIASCRDQFPTVKTGEGEDKNPAMIPFSSEIKFNLIIRDMNTKLRQADVPADNICVYIKGAPDKVLLRCSKVLVRGEELPYDEAAKSAVMLGNDTFARMGERVLAFAKRDLETDIYNKGETPEDSGYPFDVKTWKSWNDLREYSPATQGWFPMWDFTLVGLVSLNDPPRPKVDVSVQKCKNAGIKVIMVTGDQPPTAAAIAHKVNIITKPELEYNAILEKYAEENPGQEMDREEAFAKCNSIVIHGDTLAKIHAAEDALEDDEIEKGRVIMDWIRKPEVVFARTTPSQKLLIVDACQRLGHVVAVTGDGVNDSPAIKKADIGIAMGTGSEVAQNAADMLLLDDNFSSIVNGVEEGRLIFDNLKKSIAYTLSSNIPEISPFIIYMAAQVPLPLSTVLILCIDLGTDMVPAISFAYENPELDIMERFPRNSQRDHLVNAKLVSFAYLQIGIVQASAGFFTYFYMLNDYGWRPATLFNLIQVQGYYPAPEDVYTPDAAGKGNSVAAEFEDADGNYDFSAVQGTGVLDWNTSMDSAVDARLFYAVLPVEAFTQCRWDPAGEKGIPGFYSYSHISGQQVCYTTEALKYAQTGYLISIVCVQWSDLMICKTRNLSISQQGMKNMNMNFALFFETALVAVLSYVPLCNMLLGTRLIAFPHFCVPSFSCFAVIMFYDECRKVFLRRGMVFSRTTGRIKFDGWVVRNTYY